MRRNEIHVPRKQQGIVLFVALVLLLVLSLLGITLARTQTVEERLAQNDSNHQVAFQAAEAALRAASDAMLAGSYVNGGVTVMLTDAAFATNTGGLYSLSNEPTMLAATPQSIASVVNWTSAAAVMTYSGPALASLPANARNPVFLIEKLTDSIAPSGMCGVAQSHVYRITAHGFGGDASASATLQQIFYRC